MDRSLRPELPTINARYSPKYFGLKKGVVSYSLVANHIPINAEIIGANEHESHYVFDLLFNNTTDIQPDDSFDGYARDQRGQFCAPPRLRLSVRAALPGHF